MNGGRVFRLAAFLLVVTLALVGCGGGGGSPAAPAATKPAAPAATKPAAPAQAAGDAGKGKALFASTCAACHGPEGKGLPNLGKDLTTSTFVKDQTDSQLVEFLNKGRRAGEAGNTTGIDMPPKGGNPALTDKDLADIVAYVRSLK